MTIIVFSGKSGLITTANGLRIGCIGGMYDADIYASAETALVRKSSNVTSFAQQLSKGFCFSILLVSHQRAFALEYPIYNLHK